MRSEDSLNRILRVGLAIIASLFVLLNNPIALRAEETDTNEIIGNSEVQDEENADYVVPSDSELDALGRYEVDINVDENGEPFNPSGDLNGKKQFLSFRTADNEVYYIVVTYVGNSSTVNLLKDISNEDIEALSQANSKAQEPEVGEATVEDAQALNPPADEVEANESVEESIDDEREDSSVSSSWIIIGAVFIIVLIIGFIRLRRNDSDEYDE